jgi:hypothetical protein
MSTRMLISHELDETTAAGLRSINGHEKATDTLPGPRYHVTASVLFETINRLESAMSRACLSVILLLPNNEFSFLLQ